MTCGIYKITKKDTKQIYIGQSIDIERRIEGLNEVFLDETTKKFILLKISSDYTYNKAIAIVDNTSIMLSIITDDNICAVYVNTQSAFIKDSLCSFGLGLLYPFILYLFPSILRLIALKAQKASCIYSISDIIPFF